MLMRQNVNNDVNMNPPISLKYVLCIPKSCGPEVERCLVSQYKRYTEDTIRLNCCDPGKLFFFLAQQIHWDWKVIVNLCQS